MEFLTSYYDGGVNVFGIDPNVFFTPDVGELDQRARRKKSNSRSAKATRGRAAVKRHRMSNLVEDLLFVTMTHDFTNERIKTLALKMIKKRSSTKFRGGASLREYDDDDMAQMQEMLHAESFGKQDVQAQD